MKYVIWGTSPLYIDKLNNIKKEEIVAYVEKKERIMFRGMETIFPQELKDYNYDYIIVMSRSILDIAQEIINMGIESEKIIPAINIKPMLAFEAEYISDDVVVNVDKSGNLVWNFPNGNSICVSDKEEFQEVKNRICDRSNAEVISKLSCLPTGKLFGSDRGGSIVRYYIDKYMMQNQKYIHGNVLEIGDRHYTEQYGTNINGLGYVLHYDKNIKETQYDFVGDLCDGTGLNYDFYDCIILTQVLMYVEKIEEAADILVRSLKKGGTLLITVAGIANISHLDIDRYDYYWNFTESSIKKLFERSNTDCEIYSVGNCKSVCAFLQGMSYQELLQSDLNYTDRDYPLIVLAKVTKNR